MLECYFAERNKSQARMRPVIFKRDNYQCVACGSIIHLELCHFFPASRALKKGPYCNWEWLNSEDNLVTLCQHCHDILDDRFARLRDHLIVKKIVTRCGKDINKPTTWTSALRKQLKRAFEEERDKIITIVANYLKIPASTYKWYQGARYG